MLASRPNSPHSQCQYSCATEFALMYSNMEISALFDAAGSPRAFDFQEGGDLSIGGQS